MKLVRTTLRLQPQLKKAARQLAVEQDTTLQDIFNRALEAYLRLQAKKKAKKLVIGKHDFGEPMGALSRKDYYPPVEQEFGIGNDTD